MNDETPENQEHDEIQPSPQQMSELATRFESSIEKIEAFSQENQETLEENKESLSEELEEVREILTEFQQTSENFQNISHQFEDIKSTIQEFKTSSKKITDRLDQVAIHAANRITDATKSFRVDDFKQIADDKIEQVDNIARKSEKRIINRAKRILVEKIGFAVLVAFITAIFTGYYMSAQWPWEANEKIAAERDAGQTLMRAWPLLSENDRDRIKKAAEEYQYL